MHRIATIQSVKTDRRQTDDGCTPVAYARP